MSLGIDIGKFSIKLVELERDKEQINLINVGSINTFDNIDLYDIDKISKSQIIACIQDLCSNMNIKTKKVKNLVTSLSGSSIDARQVSMLDMPDKELVSSLELEAKKHTPLDGTETIIDYHHLGKDQNELDKINLILTTTTKNKISDHAEILKGSGFKPGIFDADPIALSNLYQFSNVLPDSGSDVLINIGHSTTTIVVWGKNATFFTREINISGHHITKAIIQENNLSYKEAEKNKKLKGIDAFTIDTTENNQNSINIEKRTVYNNLIEEIRKTLRFYMKNNNQSFFNTFYLSGGCSGIYEIDKTIADNLNVKVEIVNPFKKINNTKSLENPSQYSIAVGLALRGLNQ